MPNPLDALGALFGRGDAAAVPELELEPEPLPPGEEKLLPDEGPMSSSAWQARIDDARELIRFHRDKWFWTTNTDRVAGKGGDDPLLPAGVALLPKDYSYSEQKKPLLFYQLPDVVLTPARPDVTPQVAQLFAAVLNEMVGPNQLNALAMVHEVLADVLVPAGFGVCKLGYETYIDPQQPEVQVQTGEQPAVDPLTGMPATDPMTGAPVMQPIMETVPNIVAEKYYVSRISPNDFLFDVSFKGSDWAKCPWMGWRFRIPEHVAAQRYGIPQDRVKSSSISGQAPTREQSLGPDREKQRLGGIEGVELYYRAVEFDPEVGDPDLIRCLVFLEGFKEPVKHEDARSQQVEGNRVTAGLRRIPLYPLTIHYVSDMALPPSDCAMSRVLVDEQSRGRTQMWQQRDRNIPMRGVDTTKVTPDSLSKLVTGQYQEIIQFENVDNGQSPLFGITQSAYPQENFNFNNVGERDVQECWGMSGHNLGTQEASGRTATELSLRQSGTETRMATEQARVELWWISIVEGLAALVQLYADLPQYTKVVGQAGAQQIVEWTKLDIAGEFAFAIRPDSAKKVDQSSERKFKLDAMNLLMNVPNINKEEIIKWAAPSLGLDPATIIAQPPAPQPEPPDVNVTIKSESLNPFAPEYQGVVALLKARGIDIQPQPPPAPAPGLPGGQVPAPPGAGAAAGGAPPGAPIQANGGVPPLSKHQAALTGQLPGNGAAPAPSRLQ